MTSTPINEEKSQDPGIFVIARSADRNVVNIISAPGKAEANENFGNSENQRKQTKSKLLKKRTQKRVLRQAQGKLATKAQ